MAASSDIGVSFATLVNEKIDCYKSIVMDELGCNYVGSFALLKSCHRRSPTPISDFEGLDPNWYSSLFPNCVVHVCPQALPNFVKKVLPAISVPFKLLTNNSDKTLPDDYMSESNAILAHPNLLKWFSQNWVGNHPKVERIPIGIDYHSLRPSAKQKYAWSPPEQTSWGIKKPAIDQERELISIKQSASSRMLGVCELSVLDVDSLWESRQTRRFRKGS